MSKNSKPRKGDIQEALLKTGFERWSGRLSGGQQANNKLVLDYDRLREANPFLLRRVIVGLCELARPYSPNFIVGVPDGATGYAERVAAELGVCAIRLKKHNDHGHKSVRYVSPTDEYMAQELSRGVMIEDVSNRRTNSALVRDYDMLGPKLVAEVAVFDRGMPGEQIDLNMPVESLVTRPIPAMLPHRSQLWHYAS